MKTLLLPGILLALVLSGCKPSSPSPEPILTPEPTPTATPISTSVATPSPSPIATPKPAATPEANLAPNGVYYVTKYFSVATNTGVHGFRPGKQVKLLREDSNKLVVTDGVVEGTAPRGSFTNDLDVVNEITAQTHLATKKGLESQQKLAAAEVTKKAQYEQEESRAEQQQMQDARESQLRRLQAAVVDLDTRIMLAEREITEKKASASGPKTFWKHGRKYYQGSTSVTFSNDASNVKSLYLKRSELNRQLVELSPVGFQATNK